MKTPKKRHGFTDFSLHPFPTGNLRYVWRQGLQCGVDPDVYERVLQLQQEMQTMDKYKSGEGPTFALSWRDVPTVEEK